MFPFYIILTAFYEKFKVVSSGVFFSYEKNCCFFIFSSLPMKLICCIVSVPSETISLLKSVVFSL